MSYSLIFPVKGEGVALKLLPGEVVRRAVLTLIVSRIMPERGVG
jgi:hypothetical protein